jgi:hypothetical protein
MWFKNNNTKTNNNNKRYVKHTWKQIFIMLTYANMNIKKTWRGYGVKSCLRLVLNILHVIENYISIYAPWAPSSMKFFKKLPIYVWPMFTHVWTMNELILNWKWIKIQLRMGLDLIKNELKMN